jgi:hypothetical protein
MYKQDMFAYLHKTGSLMYKQDMFVHTNKTSARRTFGETTTYAGRKGVKVLDSPVLKPDDHSATLNRVETSACDDSVEELSVS